MAAVIELVSAVKIKNGEKPCMTPTRSASDNWFQKEILTKISEVKTIVDESLKLGRENGEAIRSLRTELGVDGGRSGRLPQLEDQYARLDRQQEKDHKELLGRIAELSACIDELK